MENFELGDDVVTSPAVQRALQDFIIEAIDEATDLLVTGDTVTRTNLIKFVLASAMRTNDKSSEGNAERILAETRKNIAGILDVDEVEGE